MTLLATEEWNYTVRVVPLAYEPWDSPHPADTTTIVGSDGLRYLSLGSIPVTLCGGTAYLSQGSVPIVDDNGDTFYASLGSVEFCAEVTTVVTPGHTQLATEPWNSPYSSVSSTAHETWDV